MKVRVNFTINVDPDAWEQAYGTDRARIREDVKSYAYHVVVQQFDSNDLLSGYGTLEEGSR